MLLFFMFYTTRVFDMRNAMWVGGGITGMGEIPMLGVKEKGIAKVIRDIFRNGEKGFFYDPSDMETLYQDAPGTTEVNSIGQPVGLMLDKSKSLILGTELNTNKFTTNLNGWAVPIEGGAVIEEGEAKITFTGSLGNTSANWFKLSGTYKAGKRLLVTFDATHVSGTGSLQVGTAYTPSLLITPTSNGKVKRTYIAYCSYHQDITAGIVSFGSTVFGDVWKISNVSVKEVLGSHALQATSAARPIFRQNPILGAELLPTYDFTSWAKLGANTTATANSVTVADSAGGVALASKLQVGKTYKVSLTLNTSASSVLLVNNTNGITPAIANATQGRVDTLFTATNAGLYIRSSAGTATVTGMSIKEVTGYHMDQNYIEYDGVDDKLITSLPAPLTNASVFRAVPGVGTQVKYNQTLPMLYEDSTNHSGLVAIDRALTRSEQLRLMTELDKKAGATSLETLTFKVFDDNQEGFVYDPNDLSTLYQDVAGTVPVTAAGQPVGLILDKSKGLVEGSELHQNGEFNSQDSWSSPVNTSISGGKLILAGASSVNVTQQIDVVTGKTYKTVVTVLSKETGSLGIRVAGSLIDSYRLEVGVNTLYWIAPSSGKVSVGVACSAAAVTASVDTISTKEIKGNHAYQTTSASRPILRQDAVTGANYLEFDGVDDHLMTSLGSVTSDFTTGHACAVLGSTTKSIFSGETTGYLRTSGTLASVYSNASVSYPRGEKDVLVQKVANRRQTLTTNLGGGDASNPIEPTNSVFWKPYSTVNPKTIGNFSPTHSKLAVAMNYYGGFFIAKGMTSLEETAFRNLFNKRMGI